MAPLTGCSTDGVSAIATVRSAHDYGLLGADASMARQSGLASADWCSPMLPRKQLKALMQRSDGPAIRDTAIWFALLVLTGGLGVLFWGRWPALVAFACYGVLYGSASDSRRHECGHGTAFRSHWMNDAVSTVWRWSHARHHTDTIIVGCNPEIAVHRPPDFLTLGLNLFALRSDSRAFAGILLHAAGRLTAEERDFISQSERYRVRIAARLYVTIFAGVIAACFVLHSILPAMLIGMPTFYGAWLQLLFGTTQHAGLAEDVLDHRLNSRIVRMNPLFRFLHWNMNYHQEHHMSPMVPYHALPALHAAIRAQCPEPYGSLFAAYREIVPALLRQARDPAYCVQRTLPPESILSPAA